MKPEHILQSDVLDIVFEHRNKAYGAYELRKHYQSRLKKSLLITVSVVAVFAVLQSWKVPHKTISIVSVQDIHPVQLVEMELKEKQPKPLPVKQSKPVASVNYQVPVIVKDKLVTDSFPTMEQMADKLISNKNADGEKITENTILSPENNRNNKDITTGVKEEMNYDIPLKTAEIMPQFPGGMEAFMKFMQRNMQQPDDMEEGRKMVVIASFVVDAFGNIIDVRIDQKARPDLDAEVMRVLKKMPTWEPGKQNGRNVPVFFRLPVTFISGE